VKYKKILMIFLLFPFLLGAANDRDKPEVGIVEQLGKYLPLDLTFKDSSGKDVKLNDLIDMLVLGWLGMPPRYMVLTGLARMMEENHD
jgi:hypothetical protein